MYSYLRGLYKGPHATDRELVLLETGGIGYEIFVPPSVEQQITASCRADDPLLLYVGALATRDQPWPQLFGFLRPEEKAFWDLLRSVPRVGGKGAARAMAVPLADVARAIQDGNKPFLDSLPGVTLDGAERMIASLRKKVAPFVTAPERAIGRPGAGADETREDAVALLVGMGIKRPDAQRAVDGLLASRSDVASVQDIITEFFRSYSSSSSSSSSRSP